MTLQEHFAEQLKLAHRELHNAKLALDGTDESHQRYARALYVWDRLNAQLPFVLAGVVAGEA